MFRHALGILLVAQIMAAQQQPGTSFEVASVKVDSTDAYARVDGGPGTADPGHIRYEGASMLRLLYAAYGLDFNQIEGPSWMAESKYSVSAKLAPGTTASQVPLMWQDLLRTRFHLQMHLTSKEFPVWELRVVDASKLTKAAATREGFPEIAEGQKRAFKIAGRDIRQTFRDYSMTEFAQLLKWNLTRPGDAQWTGHLSLARVVDKTGLAGTYSFTFEYAGRLDLAGAFPPALPDGEVDTAPDFFAALRLQLGLEVKETKARFDVLVVDRLDRVPTEN